MAPLLILGAGYLGAALGQLALSRGESVTLADNWYATDQAQVEPLAAAGARVVEVDIRSGSDLERLLADRPRRVYLFAAQASRVLSEQDPDYTEETNLGGVRRVGEAVARAGGPPLVFASSLHVYGPSLAGEVRADHPYGPQLDLAHLSKVYGELCLMMQARRHRFDLAILRLGIVYGPSPVEHSRPESQTVVDKFRRQAEMGERPSLDDGGRATIGVVHIDDATRIMLDLGTAGVTADNLVAESVTVADVAALALGRRPDGSAQCTFASSFEYHRRLADYLRG